MAPPPCLKTRGGPGEGLGGEPWPVPKLAERIKRRLPLALHVGEMWEETHFHSHIVGPISLSRSDPPFRDLFVAPEICSFEPRLRGAQSLGCSNAAGESGND